MHDPASKLCSSYRFFDILEIRCKVTDHYRLYHRFWAEHNVLKMKQNLSALKLYQPRTLGMQNPNPVFGFLECIVWGAFTTLYGCVSGQTVNQKKKSVNVNFFFLSKRKSLICDDVCGEAWTLLQRRDSTPFLELNCTMMLGNGVYLDSSGMNQSVNTAMGVEPNHCRILPDGKRRCEGATYSPSHAITWWSLVKCRQRISIFPLM